MSSSVLRSGWPLLLAAILVFVLLAGCTGAPSGPAPVTTPVTPAVTPATTTPVAMITTMMLTTPVPETNTVPPTPATPSVVAVTIQNFAFNPASVTVSAGATVTWTNKDQATHSIVSDAGKFSSSNLPTGQSFSFTFTVPGSYPYHCGIHTGMHGTVIVT